MNYQVVDQELYEEATDTLVNDLKDIRDSSAYSDMTICLSDGTKVACHRVIIYSRCEFFRKALGSGFEESNTGVVNMFNDPPEAVRALVDFMYTARYEIDENKTATDVILFHLDVLIIAQTYVVKELQKLAAWFIAENFMDLQDAALEVLPDVANAFERLEIDYAYGWDRAKGTGMMGVDSLEDWAWCFRSTLLCSVYSGIRDELAEKASKFMELLTEGAWKEWMLCCSEDAMYWLERQRPGCTGRIELEVRCPHCDLVQERYFMKNGPAKPFCYYCDGNYSLEEWFKHVQRPARKPTSGAQETDH